MNPVHIWTDGACKPNPGAGGWAAVLQDAERRIVLRGAIRETTNQRMELTAIIEALESVDIPSTITLVSDSRYAVNLANRDYTGTVNLDLIERLFAAAAPHQVTFVWKPEFSTPEMCEAHSFADGEAAKLRDFYVW